MPLKRMWKEPAIPLNSSGRAPQLHGRNLYMCSILSTTYNHDMIMDYPMHAASGWQCAQYKYKLYMLYGALYIHVNISIYIYTFTAWTEQSSYSIITMTICMYTLNCHLYMQTYTYIYTGTRMHVISYMQNVLCTSTVQHMDMLTAERLCLCMWVSDPIPHIPEINI